MRSLISLILFAAVCAAQVPISVTNVEGLITVDAIAGPLEFLSSDALEGRGVGSRGDRLARDYIASTLRLMGCTSALADGGFQQPVPIVGIRSSLDAPVTLSGPKGTLVARSPEEFTLWASRPDAQSVWREAEVVFIGYGIEAPEFQWDDYKGCDLAGKVALVMNNDPSSDPALFAGSTRLYYGRWSYKYEQSARRGAIGTIVIHTTPSAGYPFQVIQAGHGQEHFYLPFNDRTALPVQSWCSEDAAKALCTLGGFDLDTLRTAAETREFKPVPLGVRVSTTLNNTVRELASGNVVARWEGSDPELKQQHVVVSAHFDHLGIGTEKNGDAIYNGALDNASGCAAMLALARAITALPERPKRSIIFTSVTAEESGLLGSEYFATHPPVPVKSIVANYNIDGINIWGRTKDLAMVGYGKNSLTALAAEVAARRGRTFEADPEGDKGMFYRSDHFNFARVGVPCAYFKAGSDFFEDGEKRRRVKQAYTTFHYHQPSDQMDARWHLDGAVDDLRLMLECLLRTAQDPAVPSWTKGDEFEKAR
ncbi:MAG: M20/M25/M40 family metallo-hydrolase [Planctomycetes bacterium]|nr:M20/M25/M40 family metallo-hydrolase [Planctomycetota bacterium]